MLRLRSLTIVVALFGAMALTAPASGADIAFGSYRWPVTGPVTRGFESPTSPYTAGHRGIDIAVPFGTPVVAAQSGTVAFAGKVAGSLFVSIDHADGIRTTYSWMSVIDVKKGQQLAAGSVIGATGVGHPGSTLAHLHFGARFSGEYLDPMLLLSPLDLSALIHLTA